MPSVVTCALDPAAALGSLAPALALLPAAVALPVTAAPGVTEAQEVDVPLLVHSTVASKDVTFPAARIQAADRSTASLGQSCLLL